MGLSCSVIINSLGLLMDIAGAVLLWRYGLPEDIRRDGRSTVVVGPPDEGEKAKAERYEVWSRIGLLLLIMGFALQLLSNFLK